MRNLGSGGAAPLQPVAVLPSGPTWRRRTASLILCSILGACSGDSPPPLVLRLVDELPQATVAGTPPTVETSPKASWRFVEATGADALLGWSAGPGVTDLQLADGRLSGRTNKANGVIRLERPEDQLDDDVLHAIEVTMRASAGANLSIGFSSQEELDIDRLLETTEEFGWVLSTPIAPGDELQSYTISPSSANFQASFRSSSLRHIVVQPADDESATFEIETLRLVFRTEHLASIPAGVGWHGLADIFRETLVARSPETATFTTRLGSRPRFEAALGSLDARPVTFEVSVRPVRQGAQAEVVMRRTLTRPDHWHDVAFELPEFADDHVELTLALVADEPGAIGFWGTPAIRDLGRGPEPAEQAVKASKEALGEPVWRAPKGVIVVLLDTLRRDHLEAYGHDRPTAPTLAKLAEEGVLFEDALAQGMWTKVSVPSMLSSTYPTSNGIYDMHHRVSSAATTLTEAFREAGYATWHTSSVPFSGRASNLHQGVEVLHERSSIELPEGLKPSKTMRVVTDRFLDWLDEHHEVPFFAFVHGMDPHDDYEPYPPYDTMWAKPGEGERHRERVEKVKPLIESEFMKRRGLPLREELEAAGIDPQAFVDHELDWYDGSIRGADAELARIVERLDQLGLRERTLIVFVSDHGEEFLDHGGHFHEENVYGELQNVPLVFSWPDAIASGRRVADTVQLLDVAPTILQLAAIPLPDTMQGQSLAPLLSASDDAAPWQARPAIGEWKRRRDQQGGGIDAFSIVDGGWKLIHNVERPDGYPEYELYDHRADPLDQNDLAAEHPDRVEQLAAKLDAWHTWALENRLPTSEEAMEGMSDEELKRLRSLGYI